jgi:PilZ domain
MERRRDFRSKLNQAVRVTVLGRDRYQVHGKAADLSGRGIRILIPVPLPAGDPVRIDLDDTLLLGEVCYCEPEGRGFMIGVQLDQAINDVAALARLNVGLVPNVEEHVRGLGALSYSISEQT